MIFFCSPTHHVVRIVKRYSVHIECFYCHPLVTFPNTDVHNLTLTTYLHAVGGLSFPLTAWGRRQMAVWQPLHYASQMGVEEGFTEYAAVIDTLQHRMQSGMVNHVHKRPTHSYGFNDDSFASSALWQIFFLPLSLQDVNCDDWFGISEQVLRSNQECKISEARQSM